MRSKAKVVIVLALAAISVGTVWWSMNQYGGIQIVRPSQQVKAEDVKQIDAAIPEQNVGQPKQIGQSNETLQFAVLGIKRAYGSEGL